MELVGIGKTMMEMSVDAIQILGIIIVQVLHKRKHSKSKSGGTGTNMKMISLDVKLILNHMYALHSHKRLKIKLHQVGMEDGTGRSMMAMSVDASQIQLIMFVLKRNQSQSKLAGTGMNTKTISLDVKQIKNHINALLLRR